VMKLENTLGLGFDSAAFPLPLWWPFPLLEGFARFSLSFSPRLGFSLNASLTLWTSSFSDHSGWHFGLKYFFRIRRVASSVRSNLGPTLAAHRSLSWPF